MFHLDFSILFKIWMLCIQIQDVDLGFAIALQKSKMKILEFHVYSAASSLSANRRNGNFGIPGLAERDFTY